MPARFLYTAWATWRELYVISDGERLLRIALMIVFAVVGRECFKRVKTRKHSSFRLLKRFRIFEPGPLEERDKRAIGRLPSKNSTPSQRLRAACVKRAT